MYEVGTTVILEDADLSFKDTNLIEKYHAVYIGNPYGLWLVPNTTLDKLSNDTEFLPEPSLYVPSEEEELSEKEYSEEKSEEKEVLVKKLSTHDLNQLQRELNKSEPRYKTHYRKQVYDFKTGDRVIHDEKNYKVVKSVGKNSVLLQEVDMLGNIIKSKQITIVLRLDKESGKWTWDAYPGILKYTDGPFIDSVDSVYLKYKTMTSDEELEPEPDVLVNIKIPSVSKNNTYMYVITDVDGNKKMDLEYVGSSKRAPRGITLIKERGKWTYLGKPVDILIGGYGETSAE